MNTSSLQILHPAKKGNGHIRAVVFDFDGTFSTLRHGWENVMRKMMAEFISGQSFESVSPLLLNEIDRYIDESTGIQTIYQMIWLKNRIQKDHPDSAVPDEWWYKDQYNNRLMENVEKRLEQLENGEAAPSDYLINGSVSLLNLLKEHGISLYLASGTDHKNVIREAAALGVKQYFREIKGAPEHAVSCSKEAVIRQLLLDEHLQPEELLIIGDGKVEIQLGAEVGAFTLGAATDEDHLSGINPLKYDRLVKAGADAITGDFSHPEEILSWLEI